MRRVVDGTVQLPTSVAKLLSLYPSVFSCGILFRSKLTTLSSLSLSLSLAEQKHGLWAVQNRGRGRAVNRCRERRLLIKQAVKSRHLFAAAHSDYIRHLLLTGSALARFAAGEPLAISDDTPPTFLTRSLSVESHPSPENPHLPSKTIQAGIADGKPTPASSTTSPGHSTYSSSSSSDSLLARKHQPDGKTVKSVYSNNCASRSSSSLWDWENFYAPSAPELDSFRRYEDAKRGERHGKGGEEMEEVHCSERGDGYFCTGSEGGSDDDDGRNGADVQENEQCGSESWVPVELMEKLLRQPANKSETIGSEGVGELNIVRRHKDLAEIALALEKCFVKASEARKGVAELLQTDRKQLDRSFRQLKKTVHHWNNVFSVLSSGWTSRRPLAIKGSTERGALIESGGRKSHFSTLEQLLALESKLYQDVKVREAAKIEHEKKVNLLQSQGYRGENEVKLEKTKASIKKLDSLITVASRAVDTTSSAIIRVRDDELGPQLFELCHGLMNMWKSMNHFHEIQNDIVQQVHGLIDPSVAGESTTDLHRQTSHHLQLAISGWLSSFSRLTKHHRDYIHFLHSWLRLNLHPIDDPPKNVPTMIVPSSSETESHIYSLCDDWRNAADRLPDAVASEAIKGFLAIVQTISLQQSEEIRCRRRREASARRLDKKAAALRAVERKLYGSELSSNKLPGISIPGRSASDPTAIDAKDPLAAKRLVVLS